MVNETVFKLWDDMADFSAAQTDQALGYLLQELADLIAAQNAYWLGAVRMDRPQEADPYQGWRPLRTCYLDKKSQSQKISSSIQRAVVRGETINPITEQTRLAGNFRVHALSDLMPASFFKSEHFETTYTARGIKDTLFVVVPINKDAESYFGFHRTNNEPFSDSQREIVGGALRGIRWFHRQLFLSHGLQIGSNPLTPSHRKVLHELLTQDSEAVIAQRLGLSATTVHTYVQAIYRSLGVRSRAGLAALWLGQAN